MVKLLVLKPCLIARTNGGDISLIERLKILKSWGAEVQIHLALPFADQLNFINLLSDLDTPLGDGTYTVDGLQCSTRFDPMFSSDDLKSQTAVESHFLSVLRREQPDLVWTHFTDFFSTTAALEWDSSRAWIDITDNEFPREDRLRDFPSLLAKYRLIQNLMVASHFMSVQVSRAFPKAERMMTPNWIESLDFSSPASTKGDRWIFVNPVQVKGVDFVLELAQKLPNEKFLFVGNWISERPEHLLPNIEFIPRQKSLRSLFERAKGLLMPSVWEEAFGRVPLEAMAAGVPVIASNRGALPETVGSGGRCLPLEIPLWLEAMSQIKPEEWRDRGFERVRAYRQETLQHYEALRKRLEKFF